MTTLQRQVSASADDCTCDVDVTYMQALTNDWVGFPRNSAGDSDRESGFRFLNCTIPVGATITSAKLTGISYDAYSGTINCRIYGILETNTATFSTASDYIARSRTTAYANWDITASWTSGESIDSVDITDILQEIVDQTGWASGNAIAITIQNNGTTGTTRRNFRSYDYTGNQDGVVLTVEYTVGQGFVETFSSFYPSNTGWQNYDIYTNLGVPKGAICQIAMLHSNATSGVTVGVRTDGSSLSRYVAVHEAESGGQTGTCMFVKVDETTGYIETYCDTTSNVTFYLLGYITGVDYTEMMSSLITSTPQAQWNTVDLSSYSVPASRVVDVLMFTPIATFHSDMGVRRVGSSLERHFQLHEAEPSGAVSMEMFAKTDSSQQLQFYQQYTDGRGFYLLGYFSDTLDFVELWTAKDFTATSGTWQEFDLTSDLDEDGRFVSFVLTNTSANTESDIGVRGGDSAQSRYLSEHESESYGYDGYNMLAQSNSSGIVDLYISSNTDDQFWLSGYFKIISIGLSEKGFADSVGASDVFTNSYREMGFADSVSASDAFVIPLKAFEFSDTVGLADAYVIGFKELGFADSVTIEDLYVISLKELPFADTVNASDSFIIPFKEFIVNLDTISLTDSFMLLSELQFSDTINVADAFQTLYREINFADAIALSDLYGVFQEKSFNDSVAIADAFAILFKSLSFADSVSMSDVFSSSVIMQLLEFDDSITLNDAFDALIFLDFADTISTNDVWVNDYREVAFSDSITLSDVFQIVFKAFEFSDTISIADVFGIFSYLNFSDGVTVSDVFDKAVIALNKDFSDTINVNDAFQIVFRALEFADSINVTDVFNVPLVDLLFSDTINVSDAYTLILRMLEFTDEVNIGDAFQVPFVGLTFADTISVADVFTIPFRLMEFSDSITVEDAFEVASALFEVQFSDSVGVSDVFTTPFRDMAFTDSITVEDAITLLYRSMSFTDNVAMADVFNMVTYLLKGMVISEEKVSQITINQEMVNQVDITEEEVSQVEITEEETTQISIEEEEVNQIEITEEEEK